MNLLGQTGLGVTMLLLLGIVVLILRTATRDIFDKPQGSLLVQLVNIFNLFFLLIVNPLAAILLLARNLLAFDPAHLIIEAPLILTAVQIAGLVTYAAGFLIIVRALVSLGKNYQLGGTAPRSDDRMITDGPYRLIRHPLYASALSISLGLSLLIQSWAFLSVFCFYVLLIVLLMPLEEERLLKAYGGEYLAYSRKTHKLFIPIHTPHGN